MIFLYLGIGFIIIEVITIILLCNRNKKLEALRWKQVCELREELNQKKEIDENEFIKELEQKKQEYTDKYIEFQEQQNKQYVQFCNDLQEKKKLQQDKVDAELQGLVDSERERLLGKVNMEVEKQRRAFEDDLYKYIAQCNLQKDEINEEMEQLKTQLLQLKSARELTIESYKKEQEILEQQDYYRIKLSEADKEDIKVLRSIEPRLTNREALNKLIYDVFIKQPMNDMLFRVLGDKEKCGIYKITHIPSQKVYIGQSVNIRRRWTSHIKSAYNIGDIAHQKVHDAMADEGIDNFTFEVIEEVSKDRLNEREKYWINYYKSQDWGYNNTSGNK